MMEMAKVTSKGQITIPISIRRRLGINEGDKLLFINRPEGAMMVNPDTFQGDLAEYEAAQAVPATTPVSAPPPRAPQAAAAASAAPPPQARTETPAAPPPQAQAAAAAPAPAPERRYIPPMDEPEEKKPAAQVGNLDLSTLLDDIRSIGSKI